MQYFRSIYRHYRTVSASALTLRSLLVLSTPGILIESYRQPPGLPRSTPRCRSQQKPECRTTDVIFMPTWICRLPWFEMLYRLISRVIDFIWLQCRRQPRWFSRCRYISRPSTICLPSTIIAARAPLRYKKAQTRMPLQPPSKPHIPHDAFLAQVTRHWVYWFHFSTPIYYIDISSRSGRLLPK